MPKYKIKDRLFYHCQFGICEGFVDAIHIYKSNTFYELDLKDSDLTITLFEIDCYDQVDDLLMVLRTNIKQPAAHPYFVKDFYEYQKDYQFKNPNK